MKEFNEKKSCFFTGHRIIPKTDIGRLEEMTESLCLELYKKYGVRYFISGAAMGYDLLAANIVLQLRKRYPDIRLHLYLPCRNQTQLWTSAAKAEWKKICESADECRYIYDGNYVNGCMQLRNTAMVNDAYFGISYCTRYNRSGTYSTLKKAAEHGRFVFVLPSGKHFEECVFTK